MTDWSQFTPAESSGVDWSQFAPIVDRGPAPTGDPLTRVAPSTGTDNPTFTVSATPDAGAGRGFVNPPLVGQNKESIRENADRLDRNITGSVISGTREMMGAVGVATLAPAKAIDFVHGLITGKDETGAQDYAGRTFVDPNFTAAEQWAPKPEDETHIAGKVLNGLARMVPTIATAIATGGGSAIEQGAMGLEAARQALIHGMKNMSVPAFSSGIAKSADLIQKGAPIGEAVIAGLTEGATTDVTGGLAMSAPGANMASRFVQGAAVGATTGDVARQAQNLAAPDFQTERTPEGVAVSALTGGVLGAGMGHPQPRPLDARPKVEIADIFHAPTVDEAINVASEALKDGVPNPASVEAGMLAIRPLRPSVEQIAQDAIPKAPDVSQPVDIQPLAARADGGGGAEPVAGLDAGLGVAGDAGRAVEPARVADEPAGQPVPLDTTGAAAVEPKATWFGRRGDGYVTQGDAQMALASRQKVAPDLSWKIEQMPSGKYRLAGYEGEGAKSADAIARPQETQAASQADAGGLHSGIPLSDSDSTGVRVGGVVPADAVRAVPKGGEGGASAVALADQRQADNTNLPVAEVSRYNGKFGAGMGRDAARLEASRLNRQNDGVTYTAEEHGDANLEHPFAVVGRKAPEVSYVEHPADAPLDAAEQATAAPEVRAEGNVAPESVRAVDAADSGMMPERPRLTNQDLAGKTADELDALHSQALEHNRVVDLQAIRKFFGPEQANEAESWNRRRRESWLSKNETNDVADWTQARYINDELIAQHRGAGGDFDTESPEALGRSIAIKSKNVDEPGFMASPDGRSFAEGLRYAKEQGWSLDAVLAGMRSRSAEWAGNDAPELFSRLFKKATGEAAKLGQEARPSLQLEAPTDSARAESILDAAGIKGAERISALKDVKSGAITADELARAHPAPTNETTGGGGKLFTKVEPRAAEVDGKDVLDADSKQPAGRPLAEYRKLQGKGGISDIAKMDAEKVLGIKSPVPVMRQSHPQYPTAPMLYETDTKTIIYNTAFKGARTRAMDAQWMTEEILHAVDHVDGKSLISLSSDKFKPGGDVWNEIEAARKTSGILKAELNYPLDFPDHELSPDRKSAELFARLGVIFKGFPQVLQALAPKTYEVYRAIFSQDVQRQVRPDAVVAGQGRDPAGNVAVGRPDSGQGGAGEQADSRLESLRGRIAQATAGKREGAVGDFNGTKLETRASAAPEAAPEKEREPYAGPGAKVFEGVKGFADSIVRDSFMKVAPMSTGSKEARATAQKFANDTRAARLQWVRMNELIKAKFSKSEREAMWSAADEQNTLMQEGKDTAGKGLDRLNDKQRATMETLHKYANELWERGKEAGLVSGDGLPFWTPRIAVMVGEDGSFAKVGEPGKKTTSSGEGRNVLTSAPSAMHRKHVGTTESEAALKAKLGESAAYVKDVLAMPLAMSRFEQAIAGRELINTIKEIGVATGTETVGTAGGPGFFTLDHPAFTNYRPRMVEAEGKMTPALDQNGEMVFDKTPIFISKEFEGPLKAVMSNKDGDIYSGYMLLKSKAMTAIMASPLTHNMVIYGRALAYSPMKVGTGYLYWKGHALAKDSALMDKFVRAGMVPIGANKNSMMDITDVARGIGRQGSWGDPNESWVSLSLRALGNAVHEGVGDKIKDKTDALGDFVHHTLLWKQVGALQVGIAADARNYLMAKGMSDTAATTLAAHWSNRYAGAVANENMSEIARKAANVLLFSRSFNMGNIGTIKDMLGGMPAGMKAKLLLDVGEIEGAKAMSYARRKAISTVLTDVGIAVLLNSVVQSAVDYWKKDKSVDEIEHGYVRRLTEMFANISDHPASLESYNPYRVSPTYDNEPGKHDRIDMGEQPGGRHEYMRLPTGKVVEDMIGWTMNFGETFGKKMSPMAKAVWQDITNDRGFGTPVMDPEGGVLKHIFDVTSHVAEAQLPWDSLKSIYDLSNNKATELDKAKLSGFATGFTFSQGHPQGPEGAVASKTEERVQASRRYLMEEVKRDLKYGDEDAAREKLEAIGLNSKEIGLIIRRVEDPKSGLSRSARRKFLQHSNEDEQRLMDQAR